MAGSQLKRLKASLKENGLVGPQQSKKQKKRAAQDGKARNDKRMQRGAVLGHIREQFNPFDLKHAKGPKFEVASNRPAPGAIRGRPGEAKAAAEEKRRQTLLVDMQHRNKVGGILDQRFGENDPTMTPEEKMLERFAREKMKSHKSSMFDLEDDEPSEGLTHGGRALTFDDEGPVDDFQEHDLDGEDSDGSEREQQRLKRVRAMISEEDGEAGDGQPERKKTKKEVMEEVIAKSKMHRFERQQAKEDDEDLRAELNEEFLDLRSLMVNGTPKPRVVEDSQGFTSYSGKGGLDRAALERNLDLDAKKLKQDTRARPSSRTKTEEEKAEERSERLRELEEKRQKRMRGEPVSDSEDEKSEKGGDEPDDEDDDGFGLGAGIKAKPTATELGFDDEDDFVIDDDLVASGSDLDLAESEDESGNDDDEQAQADDDDDAEYDDDFSKGLLNEQESRNLAFTADALKSASATREGDEGGLPYTFPCPQSQKEFEKIVKGYPLESIPTIVQRIRALHDPKLDSKNKERLANFSMALVDFISSPFGTRYDPKVWPSFTVLESLIRHLQSLSKKFPIEITNQFRQIIKDMRDERPLELEVGDLVLLSAVGTIFPTSDHFHQVVTPAMLVMARYLGHKIPQTLADHAVGVYLAILCVQYQQLSKRYFPEVVNFLLNTISALSPTSIDDKSGRFPLHQSDAAIRIQGAGKTASRRLNFSDCVQPGPQGKKATAECKVAIIDTALQVFDVTASDTWTGKSAFQETFDQAMDAVLHLSEKSSQTHLPAHLTERVDKLKAKLERMVRIAGLSRRPLELHHHRRIPIKTFIPKFEETFDPDKHYDPNRERAEQAKLKAEYKKERKGAMRELRKDANFMAREKLKVKKAKDEAYEKKMNRVVSMIQSEEGREANEYERERRARKRKNR